MERAHELAFLLLEVVKCLGLGNCSVKEDLSQAIRLKEAIRKNNTYATDVLTATCA